MAATTVTVDHRKMAAVVARLDTLIDDLDSRGTSGSYAGLQDAAMVAQAVCSVNQKEMGEYVQQYNKGFGAAANDYRNFCQLLVEIRNAIAKTANIHLENDTVQATAFAPLKAGTSASGSGTSSGGTSGGGGQTTTVEAPGPLGQSSHSPGSTSV